MTVRVRRVVSMAAVVLLGTTVAPGQDPSRPAEPDKEDEKLGERLIRQAATDTDEDLMAGVMRLMDAAARKLEIHFDPGDETQAVQRRILDRLDDAIKAAAAQRRPRRTTDRPSSADKRRMPKGQRSTTDRDARASGDAKDASAGTTPAPEGTAADREPADGNLAELRRTWGHLPMREREEIIQGIGESFLEQYRDWIERYYRALQEAED